MDTLQDFLTLAATVIEYFFFAYLAVALMVYSLQSPDTVQQLHAASASQADWRPAADPSTSFAVMAG